MNFQPQIIAVSSASKIRWPRVLVDKFDLHMTSEIIIYLGCHYYCKYYSQGIVVSLVSNGHVDNKLLIDQYWVQHSYLYTDIFHSYTRIHFIHISLAECYYTFNNKDHWDPGLFTCYTLLNNMVLFILTGYRVLDSVYLNQLSGACHPHIFYHDIIIQ